MGVVILPSKFRSTNIASHDTKFLHPIKQVALAARARHICTTLRLGSKLELAKEGRHHGMSFREDCVRATPRMSTGRQGSSSGKPASSSEVMYSTKITPSPCHAFTDSEYLYLDSNQKTKTEDEIGLVCSRSLRKSCDSLTLTNFQRPVLIGLGSGLILTSLPSTRCGVSWACFRGQVSDMRMEYTILSRILCEVRC